MGNALAIVSVFLIIVGLRRSRASPRPQVPPTLLAGLLGVIVAQQLSASPLLVVVALVVSLLAVLSYLRGGRRRRKRLESAAALGDPRRITTIVGVGTNPQDVAVTGDGSLAFVPALGSGTLAIVDLRRQAVRSMVRVGRKPVNVLALPDGDRVLVSCLGGSPEHRLVVVDVGAGRVTATIPGITQPRGSAVSNDGQVCYVTSMADDRLYQLDPSRWVITGSVETGRRPCSVVLGPDGSRAYVANFWSDSIAIVDTRTMTVTQVVPLGARPSHVRLSPSGSRLFVACLDGYVYIVDTAGAEIAVAGRPTNYDSFVAADPASDGICYLVDGWNQTLLVLDDALNPLGTPVPFGNLSPITAAPGPSGLWYVACQAGALDVLRITNDQLTA
jgi:YVTN family beta-propeller protein